MLSTLSIMAFVPYPLRYILKIRSHWADICFIVFIIVVILIITLINLFKVINHLRETGAFLFPFRSACLQALRPGVVITPHG